MHDRLARAGPTHAGRAALSADTASVLALRARRMPIRRLHLHERVVLSMWFVPVVCVVGALLLSLLTIRIDRAAGTGASWLPFATPGAAETLSGTVAAGMLTFTGVVFSTTLVAIQLAGGQSSPRVVRVFVRSTLTHVTLGIFLATFVVAVNALIATREGVSAGVPEYTLSALYLMVAATLAAFITFCHGIVRLLARALDGRAGADSPSPPAAIAPEEATP